MTKQIATMSRLRRSVIYQPVAAVVAILLMPTFAWLESTAGIPLGPTARSFQSSAQNIVVEGCGTSRGNKIIQNVCVNGTPYDINGDLTRLEADAVSDYLQEIGAPASDAGLIYSEGRTDLRNAIRGQILALVLTYITESASTRNSDPHATMVYNWMQALVQQNEIAEYQAALAAYQAWQANPCTYVLDPTIAAQYNLSYNGAALCEPQTVAAAGPPFVPAASYFLAVGLEQSYGKPSQTTPDFAALVDQTGIGLGATLAIATTVGSVAAGTTGALTGAFASQIFPFATWTGDWTIAANVGSIGEEATETAPAVAEAAGAETFASGLSAALSFVGPPAIVLECAIVLGVAAYQVQQNQQNLNQLNNLPNLLAQAQNTPPDLNAFATDTSGLGIGKLNETLVAQTLPDIPSSAPLPLHNPADPVFVVTAGSSETGTVQNSFTYDDWNGITWQATTSGGWFDLTCQGNSSGQGCPQADSFNGSIQYVDWSGKNKIAARNGNSFTIADLSATATKQACSAALNNLENCSSYSSNQIQYMYQGNQYTATLSHLPAFTSSATIYFTWQGAEQEAIVTAEGLPAPAISMVRGTLPPDSEFLPRGYGSAEFVFEGYELAQQGTYTVTLQAQNSYGTVTQDFNVVVAQQLQITSSQNFTGNYGQPLSFLVTTTGVLPMTLSISPGLLPTGLTFHDNGNGTATISGTPTQVDDQTTLCIAFSGHPPCTPPGITASNAQGSVTQPFAITINPPPEPVLTTTTATFIDGVANTFTVRTAGATTPVAFEYGALPGTAVPSWLSFQDNGNGTGTLSGTPPQGTSGSYTFQLLPYANVPVNGVVLTNAAAFTVNVLDQPAFLNPNTAKFLVGNPGSFTISTNQSTGPITVSGALPNGLEFTDNGDGTATISGTPAADSEGVTTLQLSLTDIYGTGAQTMNLQVDAQPAFVTSTWANFYVGQENSFPVQVSGYPLLGTSPVSVTTPTYAAGGVWFNIPHMPVGLTWSNLNPEGYNTGTLIISGNPTSSDIGQHTVLIAANNGVGSTPDNVDTVANQSLTLNIEIPGDVNGDGVVNCTDIDLVRAAFGKYMGQPGYNPAADVNNDGVVNVDDLAIVAKNLPKGTVCQ